MGVRAMRVVLGGSALTWASSKAAAKGWWGSPMLPMSIPKAIFPMLSRVKRLKMLNMSREVPSLAALWRMASNFSPLSTKACMMLPWKDLSLNTCANSWRCSFQWGPSAVNIPDPSKSDRVELKFEPLG